MYEAERVEIGVNMLKKSRYLQAPERAPFFPLRMRQQPECPLPNSTGLPRANSKTAAFSLSLCSLGRSDEHQVEKQD